MKKTVKITSLLILLTIFSTTVAIAQQEKSKATTIVMAQFKQNG